MSTTTARDERVTIRTSRAERATWSAAARRERLPLSRWMRRALHERAAAGHLAARVADASTPAAARTWLMREITRSLATMPTEELARLAASTSAIRTTEGSR